MVTVVKWSSRHPRSRDPGRILGSRARACQSRGWLVGTASIGPPKPQPRALRLCRQPYAHKTVAARNKKRLCCPRDRRKSGARMSAEPVTIKKYANRRLYHAATGSYLTRDDLGGMVEDEEDFVV